MPMFNGRSYTVAGLKGANGYAYAGPPASGSEPTMFDQMLADILAELAAAEAVGGLAPGAVAGVVAVSNGTAWIRSDTGGQAYFFNDSANAKNTRGITVNQETADDELFAGKSSDVAHGITDVAEDDTFVQLSKVAGASGGAALVGLTEGTVAIQLIALGTTDNTTKSAAGSAYLVLDARKKSGTGAGAPGADANLLAIGYAGTQAFLFDKEGSGHADVEWTTF